jgi:DNA-binding response OmpR family regulator
MKPTLLIGDDDAELRDLFRIYITGRGYDVETASDGLDCLAKLRRATPAAVVLDLELRWGGGDGVLAWLREERAAPRVPVILTATGGSSPDAAKGKEPPVVQVLPKPFKLTALLMSVRAAVAHNARTQQFNGDHLSDCSEPFIG